MDIVDLLKDVGLAVAAVTGVANFKLLLVGKQDNFKVAFGPLTPSRVQGTMLYVVSFSDFPIQITDYGFINDKGRFVSIPDEAAEDYHEESSSFVSSGSTALLKRPECFEAGFATRFTVAGVYAITATQKRPKIHFGSKLSWYKQLKIRCKLLYNVNYLLWPIEDQFKASLKRKNRSNEE